MLVGRNKEVIKKDQYLRTVCTSAWCWPSMLLKTTRTSLLFDAILGLQTAQRDLYRERGSSCSWNAGIIRSHVHPSQYVLCLKN
jgi:hypothetical protein